LNSKWILDAMESMDEEYIVSAAKRLAYDVGDGCAVNPHMHRKWPLRKGCLSLAAAIAVMLSMLITAMAVNEDFRTEVFEFFHIPVSESVPNSGGLDTGRSVIIGDRIRADYLTIHPNIDLVGDGTMALKNFDEDGKLQDVWFYEIKANGPSLLQTYVTTFELYSDSACVFWSRSGDRLAVAGNGNVLNGTKAWEASAIPGQPEKVLISVRGGVWHGFDCSLYLLDLEKETTQHMDLPEITHVEEITLTSDMGYALIMGRMEDERDTTPHLINLQTDESVSFVTLLGDSTDHLNARLVKDGTVILTTVSDNTFSCWAYSIANETISQTIDKMPVHALGTNGIIDIGSQYALSVNEKGRASVMDLTTGDQSPAMDRFIFDDDAKILENADGTKACYFVPGEKSGGLDVKTLGVIDFELSELVVFHRDGAEQNNEWRLGWLDENRVFISNEGDNANLYVYEFHPADKPEND